MLFSITQYRCSQLQPEGCLSHVSEDGSSNSFGNSSVLMNCDEGQSPIAVQAISSFFACYSVAI